MKIVIDTDVFLSSLFSRQGASYRVVSWLAKEFSDHKRQYNVVSNTLVTELCDVLQRPANIIRAQSSPKGMECFVNAVCLVSYHQRINFLWRPFLKDSDDDMVLEVAFNAKANYIITYNKRDFEGVEKYFSIKVLTPKEFLIEIGEIK